MTTCVFTTLMVNGVIYKITVGTLLASVMQYHRHLAQASSAHLHVGLEIVFASTAERTKGALVAF